jgi:hypothetical protein
VSPGHAGIERLVGYRTRCPFRLSRLVTCLPAGSAPGRAGDDEPRELRFVDMDTFEAAWSFLPRHPSVRGRYVSAAESTPNLPLRRKAAFEAARVSPAQWRSLRGLARPSALEILYAEESH